MSCEHAEQLGVVAELSCFFLIAEELQGWVKHCCLVTTEVMGGASRKRGLCGYLH